MIVFSAVPGIPALAFSLYCCVHVKLELFFAWLSCSCSMPNSPLSAFMDSLHKPTFLTVSIPLQPRLLLFQFLFNFPPKRPSSFPSFYLVHKAFEQCFLSSVPLSGWLRSLGFLSRFGERGTARGCRYTNIKQYPSIVPRLFCFL